MDRLGDIGTEVTTFAYRDQGQFLMEKLAFELGFEE
jgi:hypothetical protein